MKRKVKGRSAKAINVAELKSPKSLKFPHNAYKSAMVFGALEIILSNNLIKNVVEDFFL